MYNDSNDWIIKCVIGFVHSAEWAAEVRSFIDEHCIVFDTEEENNFVYTSLHEEYRCIIEMVLSRRLSEFGISQETFIRAFLNNEKKIEYMDTSVYNQIAAVEDFIVFKKMMIKQNIELEGEVLEQVALEKIDESIILSQTNTGEEKETSGKESRLHLENKNIASYMESQETKTDKARVDEEPTVCLRSTSTNINDAQDKSSIVYAEPCSTNTSYFHQNPNHTCIISKLDSNEVDAYKSKHEQSMTKNTSQSTLNKLEKKNHNANDLFEDQKDNQILHYNHLQGNKNEVFEQIMQKEESNNHEIGITKACKEQHRKYQERRVKKRIHKEKSVINEEVLFLRKEYLEQQRILIQKRRQSSKYRREDINENKKQYSRRESEEKEEKREGTTNKLSLVLARELRKKIIR